jgi:hypothetical protein
MFPPRLLWGWAGAAASLPRGASDKKEKRGLAKGKNSFSSGETVLINRNASGSIQRAVPSRNFGSKRIRSFGMRRTQYLCLALFTIKKEGGPEPPRSPSFTPVSTGIEIPIQDLYTEYRVNLDSFI